MNIVKQFISKYKTDYDFRTIVSALGSLAVTVAFALYNGYLGIYYSSVWYGTICVYYIILVILRGSIIAFEKQNSPRNARELARSKVYLTAAILLLILNLSLVVPVSIMVVQQKPVHLSLIPAIMMAAYTTYKVTMASVHLKRRSSSTDSLVRLLRTINFVDALVSILTLQNTLIMVNSAEGSAEMRTLAAITSAAVMLAVLLLSAAAIIKGVRCLKNDR